MLDFDFKSLIDEKFEKLFPAGRIAAERLEAVGNRPPILCGQSRPSSHYRISKRWDRVDAGCTVHRPKLYEKDAQKTEALLYCRKARFEELGRPCKLGINYMIKEGKFRSIDFDPN